MGTATAAASGDADEAAAADGGRIGPRVALLALCLLVFCAFQYGHISYPLVWQDEAETVMFGQRVLEYGYPRVDDGRNLVYGMGVPLAVGVKEEHGAYIGSLWGQYYLAALAVRWAEGVDDPYARTARLRLPFAWTGSLGLLVLLLAGLPAFGRTRRMRLIGATAFLLGVTSSVSLLLHLREVRYYAPATALLAVVIWLELRGERLGRAPRSLACGAALLALFNFFYPAAVAAGAWLVLEAGLVALRDPTRRGEAVWRSLPVLVVALLALPLVAYFELAAVSSLFSARWAFGAGDYVANLGSALYFLLRYEWLGAALATRAVLWTCRLVDGNGPAPAIARRLACAARLWRLVLLFLLVGARNPIFFERYFVPLAPILVIVLLLDAASLFDWLRGGALRRGLAPAAAFALAVVLATLGMKGPELTGRLAELRVPYRGPVDFAIAHLAERHPHPEGLRIATNYEAEAYMYYLGSEVVGRFHADTPEARAAELSLSVDVIIPRKAQPKSLDALRIWLGRGGFQRHDLPVADLPYNNIPELYRGRVLTWTHQFRSLGPRTELGPLVVYEREGDGGPSR